MRTDAIFVERFRLGNGELSVAVKDCIDIAGHRTRAGSLALADASPAATHAPVIAAILARGGCIVGKANMHELAFGLSGVNLGFGTPLNPKYPELIPGGSSSGSAAAVAAGLADIAIGSDTGGSIRLPAACCGVFGLKPTFGRVSREGCTPAQSSLDCVGPFARDMAGIEAGMHLIDPGFGDAPRLDRVRIGLIAAEADASISAAVQAALTHSGVELIGVDLPGLDAAYRAGATVIAEESWSAYRGLVTDPRLGEDVRDRLLAARGITPADLEMAAAVRLAFTAAVDRALQQVDALALPTLPSLPPALAELGDPRDLLPLSALVRPFNLSGHPALAAPAGEVEGRPISLQLVAEKGRTSGSAASGG